MLTFTEKLEPAFSTVEVHNAQGASVQAGKATVDPSNARDCAWRSSRCRPGTYKVIWHVLSVDTHRTQGDFSFSVGK